MSAPTIDQETLRRILDYNPDTGEFTWRVRADVGRAWNTRYSGKVAGFNWSPDGRTIYRSIRIFDWPFLGHRLAVLYMTGVWPIEGVDHADLDGTNNRWVNLRLANKVENAGNTTKGPRNKTGFKGVSRCSRSNKFRANIKIGSKQVFLGNYASAEDAHAAYQKAALEKYGPFARFE